ncbi:unannotated protein [freshwater metagenome]|uniref:Unannotated protein n=1 Tax=freshwater metagenome TaxID=449393 RepID=A0A6J6KPF8_9ZZZZ
MHNSIGVGGDVGKFKTNLRVRRRGVCHRTNTHGAFKRSELLHGVLGRADDDCSCAIGGCTNVEKTQRIRNDRRSGEIVKRELFAETRIGVGNASLGVLDLHHGEVFDGVAEHVDATASVQRKERGVGCAEEVETLPIGIFLALATNWSKETLRRGVSTDDHCDIGKAGKDLRAC